MAITRIGCLMAALLIICSPLSAQYVVTSLADVGDADLTDNIYAPATLRSAIENANKQGVATSITISPTLENGTLVVNSSLPAITVPCDFEGKGLTIASPFSGILAFETGLVFTGTGSHLKNVRVKKFRGTGIAWQVSSGIIENVVVSDIDGPGINLNRAIGNTIGGQLNGYYSIYIYNCTGNGGNGIALIQGSAGNEIKYCAIGVNEQYQRASNSRNGILLETPDNHIHHNLISGNDWDGISADGRGRALNLLIEKNFIGTNETASDSIGNGGNGIGISSSANDLIIDNVISGNGGNGVFIANNQSRSATIQNNFIGTDRSTRVALPNGAGVQLNGADHVVIDNVISGNKGHGIGLSSNTTEVSGNIIGLDSSQTVAVGNGGPGIRAQFISNAVIGSEDTTVPYNVIAANGGSGIVIGSAGITNVKITGNLIGSNEPLTAAFPNAEHGILVRYNVENIDIEQNVIASNLQNGIQIERNVVRFLDTTQPNLYQRPKLIHVRGNWIGAVTDGNVVLHHGGHGISIHNADSIEISRNIIVGCREDGIHIQSDTTRDILIINNQIGARLNDPDEAVNNGSGIVVREAQRVTIGSPIDPELANDIMRNEEEGVYVALNAQLVSVYQNHICLNEQGGIVLGDRDSYYDLGSGNDPEDADDGPNGDQNTPQLTIGREEGGKLRIAGSLNGVPGESYRIDVYLDQERALDDLYNVQGCDDLSWFTEVAPAGDGVIRFDRSLDIPNLAARLAEHPIVTTTATGILGTSPFSLVPLLPPDDTSKHAVDLVVVIDTLETGVSGNGSAELTAWITNVGFDPAFNVTVVDTVSPAFSADSLGIARGTIGIDDGVVHALIPSIAPMETVRYRVVGRALLLGPHQRYVRAATPAWELTLANNVDSVNLTADAVNSVQDTPNQPISLAPNPVHHELIVRYHLPFAPARYAVYSFMGTLALEGITGAEDMCRINTSTLQAGVYLLRLSSINGTESIEHLFVRNE